MTCLGATMALCVSDSASNMTKMCKLLPTETLASSFWFSCECAHRHMSLWLNLLSADVEADDVAITFLKRDNLGYDHICNPGRNWYVTCIAAYRLHDIFATSWQLYQTAVQFQHLCKWYEWSEHWQNNRYGLLRMF